MLESEDQPDGREGITVRKHFTQGLSISKKQSCHNDKAKAYGHTYTLSEEDIGTTIHSLGKDIKLKNFRLLNKM